jgi:DNA/RNA-binding domain of Phe-tRNA-synthetase-like protein
MNTPSNDAMLTIDAEVAERYPGTHAGVLIAAGIENPARHAGLDALLDETEARLREQYGAMDRAQLRDQPALTPYHRYYRDFGQNYHVLYQIESIAAKGKPIPRRASLVEIAFRAELTHGLLTAIHDFNDVSLPIVLSVASGDEAYTLYNGHKERLKAGDLFFHDTDGVLSSIILGPATRGRVTERTTAVAVTVYAVPGIGREALEGHLTAIAEDLRVVTPGMESPRIAIAPA